MLGVITFFLLHPDPPTGSLVIWDKLLHCTAWAAVSCSLWVAMPSSAPILAPQLALFGYSTLLEVLQHWIPNRQFSLEDVFANGIGVVVGIFIVRTLHFLGVFDFLQRSLLKRAE